MTSVRRRGSILMECVLVFPLMLLLVSMILQFAHIWMARQMTAYAAFCAARSVMCVQPEEQEEAAQRAAELACSWMSMVNLPGAATASRYDSSGSSKTVRVGRLHDRADIGDDETVDFDDGMPYESEIAIPGWGAIPGSDSVKIRVRAILLNPVWSPERPYAAVKVIFKFPLLMPLTGRMISWFVNNPDKEDLAFDRYSAHRGWNGDEAVMLDDGTIVNRTDATWGTDGRFPAIALSETCILPQPYSTARFPFKGYETDGNRDFPRGYQP